MNSNLTVLTPLLIAIDLELLHLNFQTKLIKLQKFARLKDFTGEARQICLISQLRNAWKKGECFDRRPLEKKLKRIDGSNTKQ